MNSSTVFIFYALFFPLLFVRCISAPPYQGEKSAHFNGKVFLNQQPFDGSFQDFLKWQLTSQKKKWPESLPVTPQKIPQERNKRGEVHATFINHSTVLLQVDGVNILTDPIWSERCSPFTWIGPKRVRAPGVLIDDLPPIDVILISHNHYDHLDIPTLKILAQKHSPLILTGLGNRLLLQEEKITEEKSVLVKDLDWWQETSFQHLSFTFVPAQHFSGRGLTDRNKTLWGGFVIKTSTSNHLFFAGDTGFAPHFEEIKEKFGNFQLALIPIGAYEPRWFMKKAHTNPEEAVMIHQILQPQLSLGIHWGTFQLTDEGVDDPLIDLEKAKTKFKLPPQSFRALQFGESISLPVKD